MYQHFFRVINRVKLSTAIFYFGWAIVLASTLGWYILSLLGFAAEAPVGMPGNGLSMEYHLQSFLAELVPNLSFVLHVLLLPVLAFYLALKIIRYFLDDAWSTMIALLFFSNISGFPFHVFAFETILGDFNGINTPAVKMTNISTVVSLAALSRLLNPRNLYQNESVSTFVLVAAIIFLDSLDAFAISIVYAVFLGLKFYSQPAKRKVLANYLIGISIAWMANTVLATPTDIYTSDLPEPNTYLALYFVLPVILFLVGLALLRVDYYQVLRRFGGLIVVFLSELIIVGLHYAEIYKVQLSELQFHSIFPMFHILYFLPPLFWTLNSNFLYRVLRRRTPSCLSTIKGNLSGAFIIMSMCLLALYNFRALP